MTDWVVLYTGLLAIVLGMGSLCVLVGSAVLWFAKRFPATAASTACMTIIVLTPIAARAL